MIPAGSAEFVVDASVVVEALTNKHALGVAARRYLGAATCHAPQVLYADVGSALRRKTYRAEIDAEEAETGLAAIHRLIDQRYDHEPLLKQAWELRDTVSFYDALYAVLAARLRVPLLTGDRRLSHAPGLPCQVSVIS